MRGWAAVRIRTCPLRSCCICKALPPPPQECRGQDVALLHAEPTAAPSRKKKAMAQSPPGALQPCPPAELGLQELQPGLDLPWPVVPVQGHVLRAVHQRDVLQRLPGVARLPVLPEGEHVGNIQGSGCKDRRHLSTCLAPSSHHWYGGASDSHMDSHPHTRTATPRHAWSGTGRTEYIQLGTKGSEEPWPWSVAPLTCT